MSQREGIVEDVNDESSAHHEAAPPPEGRRKGRSSGSNRGRGRPRGLQGVTRAVEALTSIIVDHVARTNTPAGEASRQVQLLDVARSWGTSYIMGRQFGALPLDWGEFKKDFLERFLPESVREARAREFLLFKQTSEMTVVEYKDDAAKKRKRGDEDRYGSSSTGGFSKGTKAHTHQRFSQSPSGFSAPSYVSPNRQRTDSQNTKSSTQLGPSQEKHNKSSCPTCGKFHSGLCYRGSGACYRCGKVGHLIRDCPQQRPESSQGSIQPTGHTTSSMGQSRGPSSNRSGGNDVSRDSKGRDRTSS
ncbi:Retrovirus-related Pol polyprotein from transposon 17.6 [Senna tora]|uniref:Retrovirus-related Pol polyprotein from transposon 17.6 n=1 Tax=Senna tora TaxID=362788 RepID=A0A834W895_9FABA|nr:Retrovirus-related Pol polyprotein from transposon 17.6 [Senna tora]